ncbi:hypothetical protein IWQ56_004123 [Coemansia nantahalensis]|uniref:Uncharacterized protein n=2 Tax=Coemansia TaxID=4863 RepID=A0ACC1LD58_9FUNG|nr:hypothetical protein IWQ56_004123 [Coemansia nantahalensis]KAJ2769594.1 hypothetical protein IWQ57_003037 [Coemansia nantahalensis]KAJ2806314.1 hypothetical protein H4R21_000918 [Coemansia helicoidea]
MDVDDETPAAQAAPAGRGEQAGRPSGSIKKRKPLRPSASRADIYVTRERRRFNGHVQRARRLLLERNYPAITIHGLGAAIPNAIKLASTVRASLGGQTTMDVSTDTVTLFDDVVPEDADADISTQMRHNSAVHITMALPPAVRTQVFARQRKR